MSIMAMMQLINYLSFRLYGSGTVPNRILGTEHPSQQVQSTNRPAADRTNQCEKILLIKLLPETCPAVSTPSVSIVMSSPTTPAPRTRYPSVRMNNPAIIFSSNVLLSDHSRVTFEESYGLQNQVPYCNISENSPELAHIVTLWTKIVEVGVEWCCTSGPGCEVVAEYRGAEVVLCAPRQLCVRCLSVSFALGRLMQLCERDGRVQGSMGDRIVMESDSVPVVGVLPRLQSLMPDF